MLADGPTFLHSETSTGILMTIFGSLIHTWLALESLTHWSQMMHICINSLTIIGSVIGLSWRLHQTINWTNAQILIFGPLMTIFCEILIEMNIFSFKKMHLKFSSAKWWPICFGQCMLKPIMMITVQLNISVRPRIYFLANKASFQDDPSDIFIISKGCFSLSLSTHAIV